MAGGEGNTSSCPSVTWKPCSEGYFSDAEGHKPRGTICYEAERAMRGFWDFVVCGSVAILPGCWARILGCLEGFHCTVVVPVGGNSEGLCATRLCMCMIYCC